MSEVSIAPENEVSSAPVVAETSLPHQEQLPKEVITNEAFRLDKEFMHVFKNLPAYRDAVLENHWDAREGRTRDDGRVRFVMGDKRYAINIARLDQDERDISITRRGVEGITEFDRPGTVHEDDNENYWEERYVIVTDERPETEGRSHARLHARIGDQNSENNEAALKGLEGFLSELKGLTPASGQIIEGKAQSPSSPQVLPAIGPAK